MIGSSLLLHIAGSLGLSCTAASLPPAVSTAIALPIASLSTSSSPAVAGPTRLIAAADDRPILPRAVRESLGPLFEKASKDPAVIVQLVLRASASIEGKVDFDPTVDRATGRLTGNSNQTPQTLSPDDVRELADVVEPYSRRLFFSPEKIPGMQKLGLFYHTVRSGEVPERIAKKYRISADLLGYLNKDFDPRKIKEGDQLKVLDLSGGGVLEVDVTKSLYRLGAWRRLENGARVLVEYVPVGLGAPDSPTPEGKTAVTLRARNPEWTDPTTKQVYKAGDPKNILGGYWIALDANGIGKSGIGLHGFTGEPPANWIEQPASHGCVRMLQPDIDRLFAIALEQTEVEIKP
jgi:lipoprotein-anchoring transpeptidase ErfK/SrfK